MPNELPEITPITKVKFKIGNDKIYEKTTKVKGHVSLYKDLFSLRTTKDLKIDGVLYTNVVVDGMGNIVDWGAPAVEKPVPVDGEQAASSVAAPKAKRSTRSIKK